VANTCWWGLPAAGVKNDLLEADVRFNIQNYDFTTDPGPNCNGNYYDIRSIGTHEAGHVFALADIGGPTKLDDV